MKLRDLQAAACVALMLSSAVAQTPATPATGQNAAATQQPADTQQQQAPTQQQPANPNAAGETPAAQQPAGTVNPTAPAPQQGVQNDTTGTPGLPQAPAPKLTEPLYLRPTGKDYTEPIPFLPNPLHDYTPTNYPAPRLSNTPDLRDLLRDGKIFLGLNDAVTLALENNYDIAIARINLDIADTDILRAKAGSSLRGVSTGIVANTLGGSSSTITGGGGPGGTTSAAGGSGAGASGLVLSTNGGGPQPELLDPEFTGTLQYERANTQQSSTFLTGTNTLSQDTATYNFQYQEGFVGGESLNVTFDNSHVTTNSERSSFSPLLQSSLRAQVTQHLLQGCCKWVNERFIIQAKNNRRITDAAFRQQLIYTVGQVESIYWALVSAYEDEQAKERALQQSTQLASDNRKQLQIGTLAPLDVVNSDAAVASDKQALITSQSNLEYQQLLMKQAIVRNLNDPQLANAPVIPTDRVSLERLPEEDMQTEDLIREAYANNPQIEQATLNMKNNQITIRAEKNGLLPVLDAYGFYAGSGVGGQQNPNLNCGSTTTFSPCTTPVVTNSGYGTVLGNTLNNTSPDWGVGVNLQIPIRNRIAQADQVRSQMEYRQSQMRLQQLYTQIRIQVINGVYALTNDRAEVQSSQSARDYAAQALEAEQKKYRLGASTTANVLQMERNLATSEDNMISATAAYARDRANLGQILASTLDKYGISITQAASGTISQKPNIPGLTAPTPPAPPKPLTETPPPMPQ
ncbi:MAG TPA: TolC family protein [Bryocella sp.]|nr:TolC family protein [Bryocella sp.]